MRDYIEDLWLHGAEGLHVVGADGIIIDANEADCRLVGYTREELIGKHISILHADPPVLDDILERLSRGEEIRDYEARLRCKDGSIRIVSITSNVRFVDGQFVHTRCFTRDITEAAELRAELKAANEELRRAVERSLRQEQAVRELSTPVLPISEKIIALILIGTVDSIRADQATQAVLYGISEHQAEVALIDLTGVPVVDTQVANAILKTAAVVKLLGGRCVLTGIRPPVAQTLVELGIDMSTVTTRGTLGAGLMIAMRMVQAGR